MSTPCMTYRDTKNKLFQLKPEIRLVLIQTDKIQEFSDDLDVHLQVLLGTKWMNCSYFLNIANIFKNAVVFFLFVFVFHYMCK